MSLEKSFLSVHTKTLEDVNRILSRASLFKAAAKQGELDDLIPSLGRSSVVAIMPFSEPSTRTRVGFEMACFRLGIQTIFINIKESSSKLKGESWDETLINLSLISPDLMIFRTNQWDGAEKFASRSLFPIINAGNGHSSHPSQSLIDVFLMESTFGPSLDCLKDKNILFVGDVAYSRVARSSSTIARMKKMNIGVCAPSPLSPKDDPHWERVKNFENLDTALEWADVCMLLRSQIERHSFDLYSSMSVADYRSKYCLTEKRAAFLKKKSVILHPGPFIEGVDLDQSILKHPSCKIRDQVTESVFIRMAIVCDVLGI